MGVKEEMIKARQESTFKAKEPEKPGVIGGGPGDAGLPLPDPNASPEPEKKEGLPESKEPPKSAEKTESQAKPTVSEKEPEKPKITFKSIEEAVAAEENAKREMHKRAEEAANLRKEKEALEKKLSEMEQAKLSEDDEVFIERETAQTMKEIRAIDDKDPDLAAKELKLMVKLNKRIAERVTGREVSKVKVTQEENVKRNKNEAILTFVKDKLKEKGLSEEWQMNKFLRTLDQVVASSQDFATLKPDEQFDLVFNEMVEDMERSAGFFEHRKAEAEAGKAAAITLGRGAIKPAPSSSEPEKPVSMINQLRKMRTEQTVAK